MHCDRVIQYESLDRERTSALYIREKQPATLIRHHPHTMIGPTHYIKKNQSRESTANEREHLIGLMDSESDVANVPWYRESDHEKCQ